jgi:HEAT repeat protein
MTGPQSPLQKALSDLAEGTRQPSPRSLREFSDLDPASLKVVMQAWPAIPSARRQILLDGLHGLSASDTLVSFEDLARPLLSDPEGAVRTRAIRLLEESHDAKLVPSFIDILADDADVEARAEAASVLGTFVELGELEEIPEELVLQVEDALLDKTSGEDQLVVRRNALESLGYSSRLEVITLIESAFRSESPDWRASALLAMGRSSDERWEESVISSLSDAHRDARLAAAVAAGELRLASTRNLLFGVLEDEDEDDITGAAIWSLSQIGGEDARIYIQNLLDLAEDDDDVQFLEETLENLEFTDELGRFDLMSVQPDNDA